MPDQNFDTLSERFHHNIYHSVKGQLRLAILQDELTHWIGDESSVRGTALDAGCGMGYMSIWLAQRGYQVIACDISHDMLQKAHSHCVNARVNESISFQNSAIQNVHIPNDTQLNLILCHAVLEWLEEPKAALKKLCNQLPIGGHMSLMFYNIESLVWRNLIKGNFRKVESGDFRGQKGGLTPSFPLKNEEVTGWLESFGMTILRQRGVRVIHDYLSRDLQKSRSYEDLLRLERRFSLQAPYRDLGRYTHIMAVRSQPSEKSR